MASTRVLVGADTSAAKRHLLPSLGWLVLPGICLLPILLYLPFFLEPFERDEGVYATIAQGLLRGEIPYRDLFDHKPPLIYVWYAAGFSLFGEGVVAPRLMAALAWSATVLLVYKQVEVVDSRRAGVAAAAVFGLSSGLVLLQANANTEVFMLLPAMLCLFAGTKAMSSRRAGWLFLTGLAGATAVMTKEVALPSVAVVVVAILFGGQKVSWTTTLQRAAIVLAGLAFVSLVVVLPFLLTGSMGDFLYANWTFNRLYGAELSLGNEPRRRFMGLLFSPSQAPLSLSWA
jgi:4-amino-4-deoxy-L-arabinose transferase-like glycosyltransferase